MMAKTLFIEKYPNLASFLMNAKNVYYRYLKSKHSDLTEIEDNNTISSVFSSLSYNSSIKKNIFEYIKHDLIKLILDCFDDERYGENEFLQDVVNRYQMIYGMKIEKETVFGDIFNSYMSSSIFQPINIMIYWSKSNNFFPRNYYDYANSKYEKIIHDFLKQVYYDDPDFVC